MGTKVFLSIFICVVLISCVVGYPSKSDSDSEEDDIQQQQQQNIDSDSLEQFTQKIQSVKGGRRRKPEKVQVVEQQEPEIDLYDPCLDAKKIGPCKAHIPRYFFNKASGRCELFAWGGCGSQNGNNFRDLGECESSCSKHLQKGKSDEEQDSAVVIANCEKPPIPQGGIECLAYIPRWTYNATEQRCEEFIWGGCPKTENNFPTESVCQATCGDYPKFKGLIDDGLVTTETPNSDDIVKPKEVCNLSPEPGNCYAAFEKYFFNKINNRCEPFIYGGCGGNENRFDTAEDCVRSCGGDQPVDDVQCADVECPWALYDHYDSLGCSPIYDGDSCCPTRYECSDQRPSILNNTLDSRSLTLDKDETTTISPSEEEGEITTSPKCRYQGKFYAVGDKVDEASRNCRAGCFCSDRSGSPYGPTITCAMVECPEEVFGGPPKGKENCIKLYKRDSCCAHDYYCPEGNLTMYEPGPGKQKPEETPKLAKCEVEGKGVYEGERIYPNKSPCTKCICERNPSNVTSLEGQLHCEKIDCGIEIYYSTHLARGCAPVYFEKADGTTSCCPISWECPDEKEQKLPKSEDNEEGNTTPGTLLPQPPKPPSTDLPFPPPPSPPSPSSPDGDKPSSPLVRTRDACKMEKQEGSCKGHRPRFFYNEMSGKCESFTYSGCGANLNNFASLEDCKQLCENSSGALIQPSPPSAKGGNTLGGPGLLGRSFSIDTPPSQQETKAISLTEVDPCTLPKKVGRCKGYFPRFHYSPEDNECKLFIFGGCRANANNFYSKESCEATCLNKIPVANLRTSVPAALAVPKWRVASEGGDASKVNFPEEKPSIALMSRRLPSPPKRPASSSEEDDACSLPPKTGRCKAFVRRYYFDADKKMCKSFTYGGCSGNPNNFHTIEDCNQRCNKVESDNGANEDNQDLDGKDTLPPSAGFTARCKLPKAAGSCHNSIRSFYYDVESKTCKLFFYSGCFGNLNRFSSREDCENLCKKPLESESQDQDQDQPRRGSSDESSPSTTPGSTEVSEPTHKDFCKQDPASGNCKENQLRFYYDLAADQCLPFVYSGCGGNKNNFITETECLSSCGKRPTLEQLAQEMVLTCTFGNETVPLGATVGGSGTSGDDEYSGDELPCGKPVCQCITPPAVTCVQRKCPEPSTTTTTEKICAIPMCPSFCKEAIGQDGCPTCDCDYSKKDDDVVIIKGPAKGGVKG